MVLIGILGKKRHGKDTIADYLVRQYGYTKREFADPLKEACKAVFGFTDDQVYGELKETKDPFWKVTPRHVLQYVGTELFRNQIGTIIPHVGKDIWVQALLKNVDTIRKNNPNANIVVTDVRFPNEVDIIRSIGGIVIRINRPSINTTIDTHSSELEIDKLNVDCEILNEGSINDLELLLKDLMKFLFSLFF